MTEFEKHYPLRLTQDVIWRDMDAYGHVNNAVFFRYFEDVRMAFVEKAGIAELKSTSNLGPILATTQCDFKLPLAYPDRIQIGGRAAIQGAKKVLLEYAVFSEGLEKIVAQGSSLLVFYDYNNSCSCEIPADIVANINALQGVE